MVSVFTRIIRGEIPCYRVAEDADFLAFLDIRPLTVGHTLVIPKLGSRNLLDADPAVLGPMMVTVQKIARAAQVAFGADGVLIKQFNEPAAGQTVFHLHVHVLPMVEGVGLRPHSGKMADHTLLAKHAEMIREALGT